jgi:hypothetical protein
MSYGVELCNTYGSTTSRSRFTPLMQFTAQVSLNHLYYINKYHGN